MVYPLSLNEQKNKYRALEDWFETPQGRSVSFEFSTVLSSYIDLFHGSSLLQLGSGDKNAWLDVFDFKRKWVLSPCVESARANLFASSLALPFDRNSMDCVIAPFAIEALGFIKNPLDELERVLKPMGHLVFWGINPLSLWGLCFRMGWLDFFGEQSATLMSPFTLKQALQRRGFKHCALDTFYYVPPFKSKSHIERFEFLNEMGKMIAPMPAGFYCLIVQKYQVAPLPKQRVVKARLQLPEQVVLQGSANWRKRVD